MLVNLRPKGAKAQGTAHSDTSSGLRPDAGDFLLFGQEKSHQREGRPGVARCARTLCCLLDLGGCGTRSSPSRKRLGLSSDSPRRHPRGQASCSARHRGPNCVMPRVLLAAEKVTRRPDVTRTTYEYFRVLREGRCVTRQASKAYSLDRTTPPSSPGSAQRARAGHGTGYPATYPARLSSRSA